MIKDACEHLGDTQNVYTKSVYKDRPEKIHCINEGTLEEIKDFWEASPFNGQLEYSEVSEFEYRRFLQIQKEQKEDNIRNIVHISLTGKWPSGSDASKELQNTCHFELGSYTVDVQLSPESFSFEIVSLIEDCSKLFMAEVDKNKELVRQLTEKILTKYYKEKNNG